MIVLMALVTAAVRLLPFWVLAQREFSEKVRLWLRLVPAAAISAMLFPSLFIRDGSFATLKDNQFLLAAVPTVVIAAKTKNLALTVIVGVLSIAMLRYVLG